MCLILQGFALQAAEKQRTGAPKNIVPPDRRYALLAATLQSRGWNFDQIFAELCKTALSEADKNPKLLLDDETRAVFGGLWIWARNGGNPTLRGLNDKALHFIGGGAFEGYWDVGRTAAIIKEQIDQRDPNNFFDLDDMAATIMGARWIDIATNGGLSQTRQWLELWASGRYTLSRSLPAFRFGHMQPGKNAPPEKIKAVQDAITSAMAPPQPVQ
jgi:hypothetical protein